MPGAERGGRLGLPGKAGQRQTERTVESKLEPGVAWSGWLGSLPFKIGAQMCLNSFNMRPIFHTNAKKSAVTESPSIMDEYPRISALTRLATAEAERHKEQPAKVRQSKSSKEKPSPTQSERQARGPGQAPKPQRDFDSLQQLFHSAAQRLLSSPFVGSLRRLDVLGAAVPWRLNRSARYT